MKTHQIEFQYKIGEIVEARNSYWGGEFESAKVMSCSFEVKKDEERFIFNVKSIKNKNRFNCTQSNIRKIKTESNES
jgi:hypothetical protein